MAETAITVQNIVGPFTDVTAGDLDITFAAMDDSDGNSFQCTGREIMIIRNDNVGAQTVTINSVDDEYGRTQNITDYSIGASEYAVFGQGLTNAKGWKQTSGLITMTCSSADLKVAVLRLPA